MQSTSTNGTIEDIVIVGGGTAGWMAAAVLVRAFGSRPSIRLIESESIGTVGVGEATIPQIRAVNRFLGVDENDFLAHTQGSFKLGIEFNDWNPAAGSYIHAFGDVGRSLASVPFHQLWLRAREAGMADNFWCYSLNAAAAAAGRFERLDAARTDPLTGINHAFHFDASLYASYLRSLSETAGARRVEGRVVDVALDGESGFIRSLRLDDGSEYAADLFIDCTGFFGLLIEKTLGAGYEDWTDWLPCDRAVAVPCAHNGPMRPYTQANARPAGWQWRIPLQHRVGNGHVFSSRFMTEDEATEVLLTTLEGDALDEPRVLRFTTGRRRAFWKKNCVALGLSSGFLEPLESTSIHLIQSGINHLLRLFPDRGFEPSLERAYNRQMGFEFEAIRDFLILHYHANGRAEAFWAERRESSVPDTLAERIAIFRDSGVVQRHADELFTEGSWLQVLLGQGIVPRRYHPMADTLPRHKLDQALMALSQAVERTVAGMPEHQAFIARNCRAPRPRDAG